jgi:4-oxalocrotonate tautomerase
MPLMQVKIIKDVFSKEQKRQIIAKLTDAMVSIEGESTRQVALCLVEEGENGDCEIGGKGLTTVDVHAPAPERPSSKPEVHGRGRGSVLRPSARIRLANKKAKER